MEILHHIDNLGVGGADATLTRIVGSKATTRPSRLSYSNEQTDTWFVPTAKMEKRAFSDGPSDEGSVGEGSSYASENPHESSLQAVCEDCSRGE